MNKKVTAAFVAAASAATIGVGAFLAPAQAYPPGKHLAVTAADPVSTKPYTFSATVSQGLPGARVKVTVYYGRGGGRFATEQVGIIGPDGKVTLTFAVDLKDPDKYRVLRVRAIVLSNTNPERANTVVAVHSRGISAPKVAYLDEEFPATASGFAPNAPITLTAIRGSQRITVTGTTNAQGRFTGAFTLPKVGKWALVATSGGNSATGRLRIKRGHPAGA